MTTSALPPAVLLFADVAVPPAAWARVRSMGAEVPSPAPPTLGDCDVATLGALAAIEATTPAGMRLVTQAAAMRDALVGIAVETGGEA